MGKEPRRSRCGQDRAPLFELAESILNNRHSDLTDLNTLLRESEELALDKV